MILGVYLAAVPNHALAISRELQSSRDWSVELRWAAIGGEGINLGWKSRRVDERSEVHHQLGNLNALIYPHGCRVDERSEPQQASELSALTYLHSPKPLPK
ncbi:MAG: hypothetical protein N2690_12585, partial [Rhodocyclaceae bacterium]|nr:hypothetical protein [Rhodocyclaceae bacterium]